MNKLSILFSCAIAIATVAAAHADTGVVITNDGQFYHGELNDHGDSVEIKLGTDSATVARDDIKSMRTDGEIDTDFNERLNAVPLDKFEAQFSLLEWCWAQGRADLTMQQAQRVLRLDPTHEPTRDLLAKANERWSQERKAKRAARPSNNKQRPAADGEERPSESGPFRRLSEPEINRLRFAELTALRKNEIVPDRSRVQISNEVAQEFMAAMAGRDGFDGQDVKRQFLSLPQERKLAVIAYYTDMQFADRVAIRTDPEVFQVFRRQVLPRVLQTCATSACHGGARAESTGLKLHDNPGRTEDVSYTNFLVLDEYVKVDDAPEGRNFEMINRSRPNESLLLNWMLPATLSSVPYAHPGDVKIDPPFRTKDHPGYVIIHDWIESLRNPRPDYGVSIRPRPVLKTAIAGDDGSDTGKPAENKTPPPPQPQP